MKAATLPTARSSLTTACGHPPHDVAGYIAPRSFVAFSKGATDSAVVNTKSKTNPGNATQTAPGHEFDGLHDIATGLAAIVGYPVGPATAHRWLTRGIRGHIIAGRRIGRRWLCTQAALVAFARASGALPEGAAR